MPASLPPTVHRQLTQPESVEAAVAAMQSFIENGDRETFQVAVAVYCVGACERGDEVQTVLGALCRLAVDLEGPRARDEDVLARPTEMHSLIFSGIMRAFYGDLAVDRQRGASAQRKADAPQHIKSGTWPKPPVDLGDLSNVSRERFKSVRRDVEQRLRRVSADLPEDDFQRLVDKVSYEKVRSESRSTF